MKNIINGAITLSGIGLAGFFIFNGIFFKQKAHLYQEKVIDAQALSTDYNPPSEVWQVVNVHDGDTIRVVRDGEEKKIRFACVDAPELSQPLGKESRDYLRSLIKSAGDKVQLKVVDTDRYGRSVAEVWVTRQGILGPELVQSLAVREGMVYPYDRYKDNCLSWTAVQSTQSQAQAGKKGVWGGDYEKPWDYRQSKR